MRTALVSMYSNRQPDSEGVIHNNMEADPFENMREQMERERDQFFKAAPRDWPSDNLSRGGMFSRVSPRGLKLMTVLSFSSLTSY